MSEFRPNWASAPGETIYDILGERGWSVGDFARMIGQTVQHAQELLEGRLTITIKTARTLEEVLGGSAEFWMARDSQFREDAARIHATDREWLGELPLGDMIRFGWLQPPPRPSEETRSCLEFFGVPSVLAWRQMYQGLQSMVAFRTSRAFDSRPAAVAAWLRQGEIEAANIACADWDAKRFRNSLLEARELTVEKDPNQFFPVLRELCGACGVAVAIVRAPQGCRASGATRFISKNRALLLLSFRYLSDDQFWFTFFHEAGHLLLHSHEKVFIEGLDAQSEKQEQEANAFAERVLIPEEFKEELLALRPETRTILRFAKKVRIAPGIIVGQLQHHKRVPPNHFNGLKRRFQWQDA